MAVWDAPSIIVRKRDGHPLSEEAIRWFMDAYVRGEVAEEQAAALCMAIFFRGMEGAELTAWTDAMVASGERLDLTGVGRPTVDKHSTGGVGDKVSLVLCPLLAACGAAVPQMGGRGLGHTGGTLDKMESIPGGRAELSGDDFRRILREVGAVIAAATADVAPADRKLYRLRDVTGTIESIPLIASSIMSKKIAEGTESLVLDVKVGRGAFMKTEADARRLAETMVEIGDRTGVRTVALLTAMDAPLGCAVGNALEVAEAVATLEGEGPDDLVEVCLALAREMAALAGVDADPEKMLAGGQALEKWQAMVRAQGGDPGAPLPRAAHTREVVAEAAGHLQTLDALKVGTACVRLGAGRVRKEDPVSAGAGIECLVKPGEAVEAGQPVLRLHADDEARFQGALEALAGALTVAEEHPGTRELILGRVG
ncbi:MAG TPA: thymidine phosphorylase [Longimicrobiales bacterium]|nr:thymidine phosphorylase [Longimicrobiales bacterium]